MHFIFDLIRKILRGKLFGEPVVLWGDGTQKRELIHVQDFVRITFELDQTVENETVNIGAGQEYSIRHFAELICDYVGYDASMIQYDPSRYVGARSKCLSMEKLRALLPDLELTPLETGLHETIDWFLENCDVLLPAVVSSHA
jgi:GDP-L-fucose synthase